jgi:rhamnopyranosyl-N-acetylglucosaminyl-diphospho-decaprenol beta-1,3/1,4-galactofuranosyltransferase
LRGDNLPDRDATVAAVIVSRDRPAELAATIAMVREQVTSAHLHILVVDQSRDATMMAPYQNIPGLTVHRSEINMGGAGGFALGILQALATGADYVWLMDDDGRPAGPAALESLLSCLRARRLEAVAPLVLDPEQPGRFAFPYPTGGRYAFTPDEMPQGTFIPGFAHLFNGLLINARCFLTLGLPDLRLFLRGDEIDFLFRMQRAKLRFGTTAEASFTHPSSRTELYPVFNGRLHVVYPADQWRRRIQYRNRGYNFWHNKKHLLLIDAVRYPYYFLFVRKGDFTGLREWLLCTWGGISGQILGDDAWGMRFFRKGSPRV